MEENKTKNNIEKINLLSVKKRDKNKQQMINLKKAPSISSESISHSSIRDNELFKTKVILQPKKKQRLLKLNLQGNYTVNNDTITSRFNSTSHDITHSIFSRFQNNFKKTFIDSINKNIINMSKRIKSNNINIGKKLKIKTQNSIKKEEIKEDNNTDAEPHQSKENESQFTEPNEEILPDIILGYSPTSHGKRTITYTQPSPMIYDKTNYRRYRTFKKYMDDNYIIKLKWKERLGLKRTEAKLNNYLINDQSFQSKFIKDELKILVDNIQYMKSLLFISNDILSAFNNKDLRFQINVNLIIEETISFLFIIPKYILGDYYNYTDRYISFEGASCEDFLPKYVTNESDCFVENIRLLIKEDNFLKCCVEAYSILIHQVDDITLPIKKFNLLQIILEKSRFNINQIVNNGKTALKDLNFDRNMIKKYKEILNKEVITNNDIERAYLKDGNKEEGNGKNIYNQFKFAKNEFTQKIIRIKNALNTEDNFEQWMMQKSKERDPKKKLNRLSLAETNPPMACIKSNLMTKMMKYLKRDLREKVISLRTIERLQKQANSSN